MQNLYNNRIDLVKQGETVEEALGGELRIIQKAKGYRYSLDAFLLAHFAAVKKNGRLLDLGCGSGVIALTLATKWSSVEVVGIEIQEELAEMARRSAAMNGLADRVEILSGDVKQIEALCESNAFDSVVSNPPYRKLRSGRINPDGQKALARHEIKGALGDFLAAAHYALKKSGRIFLIYPASRMVHLLSGMHSARLEPKRLRIVHSGIQTEGALVLAEGVKDGREELHILPPLTVYDENGGYTSEMESIFDDLSQPAFP